MTVIPNVVDLVPESSFAATWDAWHRMVEARVGDIVIQANRYDGLNRRIVRDETGAGGDKIHFYCRDGQVIEERKEVGGTINPQSLNYYVYCPHYIDAVLYVDHDEDTNGTAQRYHHLCDVTYNVTSLIDNNGAVAERYQYDPYGKVTVMNPDFTLKADNQSIIENELTFTGRRLDPATELMYFRARYYDPQTGEFISRDPLGYVDGMSLYRGCFIPGGLDPWGLQDAGLGDPLGPGALNSVESDLWWEHYWNNNSQPASEHTFNMNNHPNLLTSLTNHRATQWLMREARRRAMENAFGKACDASGKFTVRGRETLNYGDDILGVDTGYLGTVLNGVNEVYNGGGQNRTSLYVLGKTSVNVTGLCHYAVKCETSWGSEKKTACVACSFQLDV